VIFDGYDLFGRVEGMRAEKKRKRERRDEGGEGGFL
jgi:hypothetical protein